MSREELESELLKLESINTSNMKLVDDHAQQLYEMKRELSTAKAMEEHITSEIESLEIKDKSVSQKLMKHLEALNEEIMVIKRTNAENIQTYESQLYEMELEKQASNENRKIKASNTDKDILSENLREIAELELKIEQLLPAVTESEARYTELTRRNDVLDNKIAELSGVMSELQECLNSKKEEVQEYKKLVQSLQDELRDLQMELDKLKNVPAEKAAKGNSMFAELDDNRVKLKKYQSIITSKYADMRLRYANRSQELQKLHANYGALTEQIEDKHVLDDRQCNLAEMYKKDFDSLTANINRVEKELELRNAASNEHMTREMKCADELINITRKEVFKLRKEFYAESLARITSDQQLYDSKQELHKWQTEAMQMRIKTLILNQTIDALRMANTVTSSTEEVKPIDKLKTVKPVSTENKLPLKEHIMIKQIQNDPFVKANAKSMVKMLKQEVDVKTEENKENSTDVREELVKNTTGTTKKVQFSANTLEPRTTDRSRRKAITVPCVHIPSIKRE
ncbi:spindly [Carabus blaptoides fortunei]